MDTKFLDIITTHQALIYKICHLYTDTAVDVEDLFQEIVVNLWQAYPRFDGRAKVTTWMYRVGLNTAVSQLRRRQRHPPQQALDPTIGQHIPAWDEQSRQLYAAIKQLNAVEKAVVTLYLEGFSYREIGESLGISDNYVGVRLNRIKDKLRALVGESG